MKTLKLLFACSILFWVDPILAQDTSPLATAQLDSLGKEILKTLNETRWNYWYDNEEDGKGTSRAEINGIIKLENNCLVLNFKKFGTKSVNIINNPIYKTINSYGNPPQINIVFGDDLMMIANPYSSNNGSQYDHKTLLANEQTTNLYKLLTEYHDFKIDQEILKEFEEFKMMALNHFEMQDNPEVTEEQRKYIVQANALNEDKNYSQALKYYGKALEINPFSYTAAYFNMALIAAQIKNYKYAVLYMKKYLIVEPNAPDARAAQDKIYEWELKYN